MKVSRFLALAGLAAGSVACAQQNWTAQNSGTTQNLRAVSVANVSSGTAFEEFFVAVGDAGTILTSPDAIHWVAQNSGTAASLTAVTDGTGGIVAVGSGGTIVASPDGVAWTVLSSSGPNLRAVASTSGGYVAVGDGGAVASSLDGFTWSWGTAGVSSNLFGIGGANTAGALTACGAGGALLSVGSLGSGPVAFTAVSSGTSGALNAIADGFSEVAVGSAGYVAVRNGSGAWIALPTGISADLAAATTIGVQVQAGNDFVNHEQILAVGASGTIGYAIVPGGPVVQTSLPNSPSLYGVTTDGNNTAVAVGAGGIIVTSSLVSGVPTATPAVSNPETAVSGGAVQFSAEVQGWEPMSYQWSFDGKAIAGATGATLTVPEATLAQEGAYAVTATNGLGSATNGPFPLKVVPGWAVGGLIDGTFNPVLSGPPDAVLPLPNGDVLLVGGAVAFGSLHYFGALKADGTPDTAFNANAAVVPAFAGPPAAFLQADGRIMLVYAGQDPSAGGLLAAPWSVRLNADGTPDGSYEPDLAMYLGVQYQDALPLCQLQNGDYLVLPGSGGALDTSGGMVRRLMPSGALDPAFAAWTLSSATVGAAYPIAYDASGRPWLAAQRLNADGTPDPTFALSPLVDGFPTATAAVGDQLLVAFPSPSAQANLIDRLNSDGSIDPTYNSVTVPMDGFLAEAFGPDGSAIYSDAAFAQSAGSGFYEGTFRNGLMRFSSSGAFDPQFHLNVYPDDNTTGFAGLVFASLSQLYAWGGYPSFDGEAHPCLVRLNLAAGEQTSALINVSARAQTGGGAGALTAGFIVAGTGSDTVLVRGVGPTLANYGVSDVLTAAQLTLYNGQQSEIAANADWQLNLGLGLIALSQTVEAFPLTSPGDAALVTTVTAGAYTAEVTGSAGGAGVALAEVYDATQGTQSWGMAHLGNVSARALTSPGANILVVGFVVGGSNNQRVLIRASGPALTAFGVTGVLPDPDLRLFQGQTLVSDGNATLAAQATVSAAAHLAGAFPGADEAVCLTLAPGPYTAQVASPSGASGVALLEVYEVP